MQQLYSPLTFATDQLRAQTLANLGGFASTGGSISGDTVIVGNLTVQGSVTHVDSTQVNIDNNVITLNSNVVGTPVLNAGLLVNRGSSTQASLMWNESTKAWTAGTYGTEAVIITAGTSIIGDVGGTLGATVIQPGAVTTTKIASSAVTYSKIQNVASNSFLCNPTGASTVVQEQPITAFGLTLVNTANAAAARATLSSIGKYAVTLPAGGTSATITHNLNTTDVVVGAIDLTTNLAVEFDLLVVDANNVTITFSVAITSFTYRVIVLG